ncbi:alpha/beta hydrolase family protein [Maribacter halichondriae]|uniref:alpha/beta hydrolase family protein n=1 Tax=Maribacter halichondriae TaxID=2980554 RepID=UPI0023580D8D|nr:alpha/beta fold hydrolase [Maribacter sp. Hal144]
MAILITGSGPQDRNEELVGHKPFLVIADHLTKLGIAVLRYDDRGVGKSTGNFETATSADFATDVESAVSFLKKRKEIDSTKIGLIGHSEGGFIAPMVASSSKDVGYVVLLAGPGIRGDQIIILQQELIARASGVSEETIQLTKGFNTEVFKLILESQDIDILKKDLTSYMKKALENEAKQLVPEGLNTADFITTQVNALATPGWLAL